MTKRKGKTYKLLTVLTVFLLISSMTFLLPLCSIDGTTEAVTSDFTQKADSIMAPYVTNTSFNGSVLVAKGDTILFSKGYGMASFKGSIPNTPQIMFRLGSVTKQFTATAVMQLRDKGLLTLQDPVSKYIPDYPNGNTITIHHLLSHTSGIPDYLSLSGFDKIQAKELTPIEIINFFKDASLKFAPGTQYSYSNSNYTLLGYIIEQLSGKTYEAYLKDNIFTPLNMTNSGYDHYETIDQGHAIGYEIVGSPKPVHFTSTSVPYAAGALYSTVEDLYKWDHALNTGSLLSQQTLTQMETPNLSNYGYGWMSDNYSGHRHVYHGGTINGFVTMNSRYPDDDISIIILTNGVYQSYSGQLNIISEIEQKLAEITFAQ